MELSLSIFEKQINACSKSTKETVGEHVKNVQSW